MSQDQRRSWGENWPTAAFGLIVRLALVLGTAYVLYRVGFILVVVLMSVMLALAMAPLVDALQESRSMIRLKPEYRRVVATTVVFILVGLSLVLLGIYIIRPLAEQVIAFSENWVAHKNTLTGQVLQVQKFYQSLPADVRTFVEEQGVKDLGKRASEQLQHLGHKTVESGMLIVEMILVPVLAFSFLTESRPLKREFISLLPPTRIREGLFILRRTGEILQSYALGQLILAVIAGVVVWVLMVAIGVPYAVPLSLLAAVTRVIPVIGPMLGGVPIVLISAVGPRGINGAIFVLIAFTVMHLVESKVVMPRLIGHRIQLHPAMVIIVLLIGAQFFGMWGMFLAAPVAAVVKVLLQHYLIRPRHGRGKLSLKTPRDPQLPTAPVTVEEERNLERPAIAGLGHHSGAH